MENRFHELKHDVQKTRLLETHSHAYEHESNGARKKRQ